MTENKNGSSHDFIIHPGETLYDVLETQGMNQSELASRTGISESYICNIIKGAKRISVSFAKKLEYALGINSSFWINLQANYDRELMEFEEISNISAEELDVLNPLKEIIKYCIDKQFVTPSTDKASLVLQFRKLLGISNLTLIPTIGIAGAFRGAISTKVDIYVLFAWQRLCELKAKPIEIKKKLDLDMLSNSTERIKQIMFFPIEQMQVKLQELFAECGIAFTIVKNFKGAPVQGFIKRLETGTVMMCLTIRRKYADVFWFTLFHEIAHLLNNDIKEQRIDFDFVKDEIETKADCKAENSLINTLKYNSFVTIGDFSINSIYTFSNKNNVQPYITIGRLQKDGCLSYRDYQKEKIKYEWVN